MARKKAPEIIDHDEPLAASDQEHITESANAEAQRSQEIMAAYGDNLPYDRNRIIHEAQFFITQSAESMLQLGKRLLVLKEHEPHGEFVDIVEHQFGMDPRIAQKMMQASAKFLSPRLESKAKSISLLGKTKLYDLMLLDDESIESLAEGGTVAGMTMDDIDRMSSRELRQALREARETHQDHDRVITEKNKKIDEQAKQIMRIRREPDEEANQMRADISSLQSMIEHDIRVNMFDGINALREHSDQHDAPGSTAHKEFIESQITMLENAVAYLRENCVQGVEWE